MAEEGFPGARLCQKSPRRGDECAKIGAVFGIGHFHPLLESSNVPTSFPSIRSGESDGPGPWPRRHPEVWRGAIALALLLALGCSGQRDLRLEPPRTDADRRAAVDALLARWQDDDAPGAMAMVVHHGDIVFEHGYGLADLTSHRPIGRHTVFRLASVSKQFTAMAILMLAEDDLLTLEDPMVEHLPELERFGRGLRIRHLLHHTAGIGDVYDDFENRFRGHPPGQGRGRAPPSNWAILRILAEVGETESLPGVEFSYCDICYDLLALVVERASGRSFADFLEERIFAPLGMDHSFVYDGRAPVSAETATSYSALRGRLVRDAEHPLNAIVGSGGVFSCTADLFLWDQALYQETLVSRSTLEAIFTAGNLADGSPHEYGYGWALDTLGPYQRHSHTGGWLGFRTYIARYPEEELTIVLLSNRSDFERWSLGERIAEIYLPPGGPRRQP